MKTPNKIKNFAWRACRDILGNKVNLKRRTITKDDLCSECGKEPESNCHIFWFCDKVKDIWGNSMLVFPFHMESWWSFMDVVWQIVQCRLCDSSLLETTMTLCWEIWKSRNSVWHGGPCSSGKSVFQRALALMQEYRAATEIVHSPRPTEAEVAPTRPPTLQVEHGCCCDKGVKCHRNRDGCLRLGRKRVGSNE